MEQTSGADEVGSFTAEYQEHGLSAPLGLRGRGYSNESDHISAFPLPKVVRYAARMGRSVMEVDIHKSNICALWDLAHEVGVRAASPQLEKLRVDRVAWVTQFLVTAMPSSDVDYTDYNNLVLAVISSKSKKHNWPSALHELHAGCARVWVDLARRYPEIVTELRKRNRDAIVSTCSLLMMDRERAQVDHMLSAAADHGAGVEHHAIVVSEPDEGFVRRIQQLTTWPVDITNYPLTERELLAVAMSKYESLEWIKRTIPWDDVIFCRQCCERVMKPQGDQKEGQTTDKFIGAHTVFATVISSRLEGDCVISKGNISLYDRVPRSWDYEAHDIQFHAVVRRELHATFRPHEMAIGEGNPTSKHAGPCIPTSKRPATSPR